MDCIVLDWIGDMFDLVWL